MDDVMGASPGEPAAGKPAATPPATGESPEAAVAPPHRKPITRLEKDHSEAEVTAPGFQGKVAVDSDPRGPLGMALAAAVYVLVGAVWMVAAAWSFGRLLPKAPTWLGPAVACAPIAWAAYYAARRTVIEVTAYVHGRAAAISAYVRDRRARRADASAGSDTAPADTTPAGQG